MKVFKTIKELIKENNSFITAIPNNMGINLVSVKGIEYDYQDDGQIKEMKIIFIPSEEEHKHEIVYSEEDLMVIKNVRVWLKDKQERCNKLFLKKNK